MQVLLKLLPSSFLRLTTFCVSETPVQNAGIDAPITPGILPISNWKRAKVFAEQCGTPIKVVTATAFDRAERENRSDLFALTFCSDPL